MTMADTDLYKLVLDMQKKKQAEELKKRKAAAALGLGEKTWEKFMHDQKANNAEGRTSFRIVPDERVGGLRIRMELPNGTVADLPGSDVQIVRKHASTGKLDFTIYVIGWNRAADVISLSSDELELVTWTGIRVGLMKFPTKSKSTAFFNLVRETFEASPYVVDFWRQLQDGSISSIASGSRGFYRQGIVWS